MLLPPVSASQVSQPKRVEQKEAAGDDSVQGSGVMGNEGQVCRQTQIWVQVESGIKYCLIGNQAAGTAYELIFSPSVNTTKI